MARSQIQAVEVSSLAIGPRLQTGSSSLTQTSVVGNLKADMSLVFTGMQVIKLLTLKLFKNVFKWNPVGEKKSYYILIRNAQQAFNVKMKQIHTILVY